MATSREKFQLVFEAKETASKKIRALNKELAALGGKKMLKAQRSIRRLQTGIKQLGGQAKKGSVLFSRFTSGIAAGNIIANAVTASINKLSQAIGFLGKSVMVAANVEELSAVLNLVGQKAGYTSGQIDSYVMALRKSGIAQKEANQSLMRAVQGNIRLSDAVKLGRIAQDAATIGQVNSSDAFATLIDAVVKGRVVLLKSLGIQGTFQRSYKNLASTLGKTQVELTEAEKLQARLNLVFEGGEVIAGSYATAMGFASKQIRSMDRLIQDLQVTVGQYFTPALSVLVLELSSFIKEMNKAFTGETEEGARRLAADIGQFTAAMVFAGKAAVNFGQVVWNVISMAVIAPVESAVTAVRAFATALQDPFNLDAWIAAGNVMTGIFDGFVVDWNDIKGHIKDTETAVISYAISIATLEVGAKRVVETMRIAIPAAAAEDDAALEESVTVFSNTTLAKVNYMSMGVRSASKRMSSMIGEFTNSAIDSLVDGRQSVGEVFKGMAQDFMKFFIKTALYSLVSSFIPGLGSILGSMFDTPVNDRMAAAQGGDFMKWFTRGALAEAQGGSIMATGIAHSSNRIIPVASSSGGSGGAVVMHINISGNVLSDDFIEKTIEPKLRQLSNDGKSLLSLRQEHNTGERDVLID